MVDSSSSLFASITYIHNVYGVCIIAYLTVYIHMHMYTECRHKYMYIQTYSSTHTLSYLNYNFLILEKQESRSIKDIVLLG